MSDQNSHATEPKPQLLIKIQYLKDLSFEHPGGHESFFERGQGQTEPKFQVSVDVKARKLPQDDHYDVHLILNAQAKIEDTALFIAEVTYAGVFALQHLDAEQSQYVALVECPKLLFPFARSQLANVTREGGFPPLMLDPVDFHALFVQRAQQQKNQAA